jgi:hypothetical protein
MRDSIRRRTILPGALIAAAVLVGPARAQEAGLAIHVGSMGVGIDGAVMVHPMVGIRAGANYFPFDISYNSSGIGYNLGPASPQFLLVADLYPTRSFRVSGGLMISSADFELTAKLDGPVDIGGTTYTPAQVGKLTGVLETRDVSPYVGIGFGNPAVSRVGLLVDLGVAFHGNPKAGLSADGPVAALPSFQQDLDQEAQKIQADVENYVVYPVLSIGVSIGLGK